MRNRHKRLFPLKIRIYAIWIAAFSFSLLWPKFVPAEDKSSSYVSILKFSAGVVASALIHEGAHALAAGLTGTDLSWKFGNYNQWLAFTEKADSNAKGFALYSVGLLSHAVGAEIILQTDKIDKNDPFVRGMMTWNILNPILYGLDYWFFRIANQSNARSYQGDLEGIEHYSNEPTAHGFALSMAAIAAYQGYRFLKTQSWAPGWLKRNEHQVNFAPLPSGGFMMAYKYSF